jgi:hypothetical protein
MGYTLQAIVGHTTVLEGVHGDLPLVALGEGMAMIPLSESIRSGVGGIPFLPFTDEGIEFIPKALEELCKRLSAAGRVAYLEAELFGGDGTQAMFLLDHELLVQGPVVAPDAINQALRALGVHIHHHRDEFEAVGLGRHRNVESWIQEKR